MVSSSFVRSHTFGLVLLALLIGLWVFGIGPIPAPAQTLTRAASASGGGPCTLSGTQTTGYVLTATDNATGCSWQTVGGASVDATTLKNASYIADGGSANAITGTTTTAFPGSYAAGQYVIVKAANTNTGATTININSLGTRAVVKGASTTLVAGNIVSGTIYVLAYNAVSTSFELLNPTLTASDIPNIAESQVTGLTSDLAAKEPTIAAGTTGQYWRGDKSWQTLSAAIWATITGTAPIVFNSGTGAISCPTCGTSTPISGATANALVTAASATTLQTICATCTLDSSGNMSLAGSISTGGTGAGIAGFAVGTQSLTGMAANSSGWIGPASGTGQHYLALPNVDATANQFVLFGASSGGIATGTLTTFASTNLTDTANLVRSTTTNTGGTAMTLNMNASTAANAFRLPLIAGATATVNGAFVYDSTNHMLHAAQSSADAWVPQFTAIPANNDCAKWVVSGSNYKLGTQGTACGGGGSVAVQTDGGTSQTPTTLNFVSSTNMNCSQSGTTTVSTTCAPNTSNLALRSTVQAGQDTYALSASGSATTYTATLSKTLTAYTDGMRALWGVDTACTGGTSTTLNIDSLGAKRIYQNDGSTDPSSTQCTAGQKVWLAYDAALNTSAGGWRIMSAPIGGSTTVDVNTVKNAIYVQGTGTNTITGPTTTTFASYSDGQIIRLCMAAAANTGTVTVNFNSIGAVALTKNGGTVLASGDLAASSCYLLTYRSSLSGFDITASSGSSTPPGGSTTQMQYNNAGAFGGVSVHTYNGTNTETYSSSAVLDLSAIGTLKYGPVAATTLATDAICAAGAGTPACPGGVTGTASDLPFQSFLTLRSGYPATGQGFMWSLVLDYAGTDRPHRNFQAESVSGGKLQLHDRRLQFWRSAALDNDRRRNRNDFEQHFERLLPVQFYRQRN
jgi:hypothetical protein